MNTTRKQLISIDNQLNNLTNEADHIKQIAPDMVGELAKLDDASIELIRIKQAIVSDMEVQRNRQVV